jgi:putative transcriptional regulator
MVSASKLCELLRSVLRVGRGSAAKGIHPLILVLLLAMIASAPCHAEDIPKDKLLFLVARPTILDPVFSKSVVLMLPLEGVPVVVGLIVNKPTKLSLAMLFPDSPALKDSSDDAYLGGPVDTDSAALVFHAAKPPKRALQLYDDVYLSFDGKLISKLLQDPKGTGEMRLFLGRSQWAPKQLQGEALDGSWYSLRAEGSVIFDRDSDHLWKRLHDRAKPPSDVKHHVPPASFGQAKTAAYVLP